MVRREREKDIHTASHRYFTLGRIYEPPTASLSRPYRPFRLEDYLPLRSSRSSLSFPYISTKLIMGMPLLSA